MITNDAQTVTGSPRTLHVGGRAYRVHPLTPEDVGLLQEWVDGQFPDPFAVANAQIASGRYTVAQQQYLFKLAMDLATRGRRLIGTPEADELVRSMAGTMELLYVAVAKGDPAFTREAAAELYRAMTFADIARVFQATDVEVVMGDPKAAGAAGTTTA